ncbi:Thaumatin domain-containing protein [Fluoribacter dumoffii]|uniref:Thaumatin family n=1 Tax=Fluoribacter dumoffii TaxID=463 RepID=A0A377GAD1_9GAMM|nr:thaumatin family protein [Fluoribacter dumoffii]KTC88727.1 Thaumatin domain-containing protein [Fluoribacter dumoffii NY 23]MCW8385980.1 Thaumatin domain-containing protein [Fluoribacter dumoffii]MCW8419032.1 Thaumatin domain-containing protein [Fluoribacter dumoffii]MCW8453124.1 Thaumatin domain-containing protein [Fluoribacter dumoffii]MCW8459658.1 Thaumatin domain-containing protein [Fluoribacter dumoffii]
MKKITLIVSIITGLYSSFQAIAGIDPVGWTLSPSSGIPAQTTVGNTYPVVYTFTNNLKHPVPLKITTEYTGSQFTVSNGCNPSIPLAPRGKPKSSCTVAVQFKPNKSGAASLQLTMNYHNNVVPLPKLATTASGTVNKGPIIGFVSEPLPAVTYTNSSYKVSFTYINEGPVPITATSVTVNGFTSTANTCSNQPINGSGGQCTITGTFTPVAIGQATLNVKYTYLKGSSSVSVPLSTSTVVRSGSGCHQITSSAVLPLPTQTYQYSDNVVKYVFTNHCPQPETLSNVTVTYTGGSATLTQGKNTCNGATLGTSASNNSCFIYVSVVPTTTTAKLDVSASVSYSGVTETATTSEAVLSIPNQTTVHNVTFVNQCPFPVWYEFENGGPSSSTSPDPTPPGGSYQLNQQISNSAPSVINLSVREYVNGALYVRTGCDVTTGICATGTCPAFSASDPMRCAQNTQPMNFPPLTKMELFMQPASAIGTDGVYDVSMVNGFNVPAEVRSLAPVVTGPPPPNNAPYPFNCGQSAGALIQPKATGLGACPWSFSPPNTGGVDIPPNYTAVEGGAATGCTNSSSCAAHEYCGMGFDSGTGKWNRLCAPFLGYTNVLTYTGYSSPGQWGTINLYTGFGLGTTLPPQPSPGYGNSSVTGLAATYTDMWGCSPTSTGALQSGYSFTYLVCGCHNWSPGITAQVSQCLADNADWEAAVYPRINWLKKACPTAYSYNHDDASTSFTCNVSGKQTSYQITFCPGGVTGNPNYPN